VHAALGVAADTRGRANLLHVLGFIGTAETRAIIEPYRQDADERVRRAAENAITRLSGTTGTTSTTGPRNELTLVNFR
jgi:hypothetical protein